MSEFEAIWYLIMDPNEDAVREILQAKHEWMKERDEHERTLLQVALEERDFSRVEMLLTLGWDVNGTTDGSQSYLQIAVCSGEITFVRSLIEHGADPCFIPEWGAWPPLIDAVHLGAENIVKYLLDHGADVNQRSIIDGEYTALWEAAFFGKSSVVAILLDYGADPELREVVNETSPLDVAQENNHHEVVTLLSSQKDPKPNKERP